MERCACGGPYLPDGDNKPRCSRCNKPKPVYCKTCGQPVQPHFQHRCWRVKDLPVGEWTAHGKGAFRVIDYAV